MAQSFKFYTTGIMRNILVTSVTSEVAGREIEFAFDNNLDTYWKATSTANQDVIMDFGSGNTIAVAGFACFCRNYKASFATAVAQLYYSDNGSAWTLWTGVAIQFLNLQSNGIFLDDPSATETHRYWKINMHDILTIPEIAGFFLLKKHTIASGSIHPEKNDKEYVVKKYAAAGGRALKRQVNRIAIETFGRTWLLSGDTDRDALEAMWDNARGHSLPLFMVEDSDDARLVEIVSPLRFNDNKLQYQIYRPTIEFRTLPYIEDGEAF